MGPIERATACFKNAPGVIAAYAFGSVPEGRAHRESDLDLAVLLDWAAFPDRPSRAERQIELIRDLIAATGNNEIDLVILNDAPPLFGRHIVRAGLRLHVSDPELAHAYERDVQLRAADVEPFVRRGRARLLEELGK